MYKNNLMSVKYEDKKSMIWQYDTCLAHIYLFIFIFSFFFLSSSSEEQTNETHTRIRIPADALQSSSWLKYSNKERYNTGISSDYILHVYGYLCANRFSGTRYSHSNQCFVAHFSAAYTITPFISIWYSVFMSFIFFPIVVCFITVDANNTRYFVPIEHTQLVM